MNFILKIAFAAGLIFSNVALALEITAGPSLRTYPFSASAEMQARHEYILWDQRQGQADQAAHKFGFIQPKFTAAAHGMWEAGLNFNPISILEIGAGYGSTSRFYDSSTFNCENYICRGVVQRHRWTARLVGGANVEMGKIIGILSWNRVRISNQDDSKPLVDEAEVLAVTNGGDTLESQSILLGLQKADGSAESKSTETFGVFAKHARYMQSRVDNEFQYLIYRKKLEGWSYAAGVGRYASDYNKPGLSAYGTILWTWGQSQSLF